MACPFLDCIVVSVGTLRIMWMKRRVRRRRKKGKDEKVRGKENGVGSGVEVQAEGNSTFYFVIPYFHCLLQKTIRNFIPSFYLIHSVLPEF
jgi:hypothetical protein